jgi:hypothetical protein
MSDQALRRLLAGSPLEEAVAGQDVELVSVSDIAPIFFSGIRTYVVNGIAHLLFYAEQPGASGDVEHIVVARMVAPVPTAKAACGRATDTMRLGRREGPPYPDRVLAN